MTIDSDAIRSAFLSLGLLGDEKTGILRRFNVILSASPTDFFVKREFDLIDQMGGEPSRKLAEKVLIDAAQWCANGTFGGIMASPEWAQMIEPNVKNLQDRLAGLVAITNCLGWGKISDWTLDENEKTLKMTVDNSYYVDTYKKIYGKNAQFPICYMWTGVTAGYLDLLFAQRPNTFTATEVSCAAVSGNVCVFEAKASKAKFGFN